MPAMGRTNDQVWPELVGDTASIECEFDPDGDPNGGEARITAATAAPLWSLGAGCSTNG